MRPLKDFEFYIKKGTIRKVSVDEYKAKSLVEDSTNKRDFLSKIMKKMSVDEINANFVVEQMYDIVMQIIRSKLILEGYKASGEGAHMVEVSYLRKLGFNEEEVIFVNNLRFFRNEIKYEGRKFELDYAIRVLNLVDKIILKLK